MKALLWNSKICKSESVNKQPRRYIFFKLKMDLKVSINKNATASRVYQLTSELMSRIERVAMAAVSYERERQVLNG